MFDTFQNGLFRVDFPFLHDTTHITFLFFSIDVLVVGEVGQVAFALIDEEITAIPRVFTRYVKERSVFTRLDETGPVEQVVRVDLLFRRREIYEQCVVWVEQVLEDVVSPHALVEPDCTRIHPLNVPRMIQYRLVALFELNDRVLGVPLKRLILSNVLHKRIVKKHREVGDWH